MPIGQIVDVKAVVNGIVGLLATGGSTNHTMHLVAVARSAGFIINWDDFEDLSKVTPLLAKIYPNGEADVNHFHQAGGTSVLIRELLDAGLLHEDVNTVAGFGLRRYTQVPVIQNDQLVWVDGPAKSLDDSVISSVAAPFKTSGGVHVLSGNIGRGVIKTSSLRAGTDIVEAPAVVFSDQHELDAAFQAGKLDKDCVVVVRFQGPKACGMPELHKLTPPLGVLQDRGFKVALVTDGRMSGASGKVPAAIHVTPEAVEGGAIARIQDGDIVRVNAQTGELQVLVDAAEFNARPLATYDLSESHYGMGREMFGGLRTILTGAEQGACSLFTTEEHLNG
jgi:phosphogluconate dehydratase